jgi:hypothetical protein
VDIRLPHRTDRCSLRSDLDAKAATRAYTIQAGNVGTSAMNPSLLKSLPYNPGTAFAPVKPRGRTIPLATKTET